MTVEEEVLPWIRWSGVLGLRSNGGRSLRLCGCCQATSAWDLWMAGLASCCHFCWGFGMLAVLCWCSGQAGLLLGCLHWPAEVADLGYGGTSYVELLILYERWAGERLCFEDAVPSIADRVVQFRCQLHPCALMLISGDSAGTCCVLCVVCPVAWEGSFLVVLVLTMVVYDMLAGIRAVTDSLVALWILLGRVPV